MRSDFNQLSPCSIHTYFHPCTQLTKIPILAIDRTAQIQQIHTVHNSHPNVCLETIFSLLIFSFICLINHPFSLKTATGAAMFVAGELADTSILFFAALIGCGVGNCGNKKDEWYTHLRLNNSSNLTGRSGGKV